MSVIFGIDYPNSAMSLPRYAQFIGYDECAFFGVSRPTDNIYACRNIWSQAQRMTVALTLAEAQSQLETELEYFIEPTWTVNEKHTYTIPLLTEHGYVIAGGVKLVTSILEDAVVVHATDPAIITIPVVTITDPSTVQIFYPDTNQEIIPSNIDITAGTLTIEIPRCRLVKYAQLDNPTEGWLYSELANFQTTVDVVTIENDVSEHASIIGLHDCSLGCLAQACSEHTQPGCILVITNVIGEVRVIPAIYSAGAWAGSTTSNCCSTCSKVTLNYYSGLETLNHTLEQTLIRLAHSKMPDEPCGCDITQRLWKRDRHVPMILTKERIECPFGLNDGAWTSWKFAQTAKLVRAGSL